MNSLLVIHPYKQNGVWVFDDPHVGLVQEPFVVGADVIIERMVEAIPDAEDGVTIFFSATPFPVTSTSSSGPSEEFGGNWYYGAEYDLEGWLCPALFKYFERAPERLYAQVKPKPM